MIHFRSPNYLECFITSLHWITACDYNNLTLTFDLYASKISKADFSSCEKGKTNFVYPMSFPKCLLSVQGTWIRMQSYTSWNKYWFQCSATGKISCIYQGHFLLCQQTEESLHPSDKYKMSRNVNRGKLPSNTQH